MLQHPLIKLKANRQIMIGLNGHQNNQHLFWQGKAADGWERAFDDIALIKNLA